MSDPDQTRTPSAAPEVPRLVDTYKSHREALHSRVQELVNLREQIKAAAAREATDIVDAARRDVRQILVKARRELLVLTAQVQAATDDTPRALDQGLEGSSQRDKVLAEAARAGLALEHEDFGATRDVIVGARQGVQQILEGARPDLDALDAEMRVLRSSTGQALADDAPAAPGSIFRPDPEPPAIDMTLTPELTQTHRVAPLPRVAAFVAAFGVVGIIAMIGTTWWRSAPAGEPAEPVSESADTTGTAEPMITADLVPAATATSGATARPAPIGSASAPVSVRLQALRDVWLRTTIDGQADAGRLLRAGETRNVAASGDVSVRIGDAGALLVSVNGSEPTPAGRDGQVLTRVFSRAVPPPAAPPAPALVDAPPADTTARVPRTAESDAPLPIITIDPPTDRRGAPAVTPPAPAAAPANADAAPRGTEAAEGELVPSAQRWFTQYQSGDPSTTGPDAPNVTDDRAQGERPPQGAMVTQRVFDDVRVQLVGDNALYTARMTERVQAAGNASSQYVSLVSQVWMRRAGAWRLVDVRLVGAGRLGLAVP